MDGNDGTELAEFTEDDPDASTRGLESLGPASPSPDHVRTVALSLLLIFGVCLVSILILVSLIGWFRTPALKDMIGFFSTVVATLGTLIGGVVAFYFARR